MLLAACPEAAVLDGKKALVVARRANELAKGPTRLAALAAAHSELGEFHQAVERQTKSVAAAPKSLSDQHRERLNSYRFK
ncbi:MAG TPA: hypothetical protein VKD90_11690 [Gemmataceae bacterium]|nr:hypothetical protein [Gemmataceae bacterium]